jgi:RNA polymerase sigma factor (sigma-70 family)
MIACQSSGHFSREREIVSVRHYRYFFTISQQNPRKLNFGEKKFFRALSAQLLASLREMHLDAIGFISNKIAEGISLFSVRFELSAAVYTKTMSDDRQLLRRFATERSESAFSQLVVRHLPLVYSTALRQTNGDTHLAQDVAQLVFTDLARKASSLSENVVLAGWLHRATLFAARQILRGERRRQAREQQAVTMNATQSETDDTFWRQIRPWLDDALERLNKADRATLLLRFFEQQSLAEIGASLGGTEEAVRKRIARALEKLRAILQRRGVSSTTAIIAGAISGNCVQDPPAGLTQIISAGALAKGAAASTSTLTLAKGALKIMAWTKTQTAIVAAVGILLLAGTTAITVKEIHYHRTNLRNKKPTPMAMAKMNIAKNGLLGFLMFAEDNHDRIPTNFDQAATYFADKNLAETLSDDFEIVYRGPRQAIANPAKIILIQERQAWLLNGKWAKVYGFADGHVEVQVKANGDFSAFERQHTLPPSLN